MRSLRLQTHDLNPQATISCRHSCQWEGDLRQLLRDRHGSTRFGNGYLVLRYLAEDLAKELDSVLDGILRSLSSRRTAIVPAHALNVVRGSRP